MHGTSSPRGNRPNLTALANHLRPPQEYRPHCLRERQTERRPVSRCCRGAPKGARQTPPQIADFFTGSSHSGSQRVQKIQSVHGGGIVPKFSIGSNGKPMKASANTVSSSNTIEIKLDRLIDDMRLLRSQIIAFDMHLKGIEAYLEAAERSERRRESKSRPRFAAAASATARTVLVAVGAAIGATVLLYLAT
jgi:hypothetical protein